MQLADGNVPVERYKLPSNQMGAVDATVAKMQEIAHSQYGSKSPKIRAEAINIIRQAGVPEKDYYGQIVAIHEWIKRNILYVKDPVGQETLSYPEELIFNTRAGDCDDMVVLEMALLASIGIKSFPVVMGVNKNVYSHVYLKAMVPPGKHRMAGKVIPLDPIMKKWKAGQQAPKHRRKIQKEYPATEIPAMSGQDDDLADMLSGLAEDSLGEYYEGPSYLDTEDSQAQNLLVADDYEGGLTKHRTMATTPHANVSMNGLDALFGMGEEEAIDAGTTVLPPDPTMVEEPAKGDADQYRRLYNYGPLHADLADKSTRPIPVAEAGDKNYATSEIPAKLRMQRGQAPVAKLAVEPHVRTITLDPRESDGFVPVKDQPKDASEEIKEIENLEKALKDAKPAAEAAAKGPIPPGSQQEKAVRRVAIIEWLLKLKAGINAAMQSKLKDVEKSAPAKPGNRFAIGTIIKERAGRQIAARKAATAARKAEKEEQKLSRKNRRVAGIGARIKAALTQAQQQTGKPAQIDASPDAGEMNEVAERKRSQVTIKRGRRSPAGEVSRGQADVTGPERKMILAQNGRSIVEEKIKALEQVAESQEAINEAKMDRADIKPAIEAPIHTQTVYDPSARGRRSFTSRSFLNQDMLQPFAMPSYLTSSSYMSGLGELPKIDMSFLPGPLRMIADNAIVQYAVAGLAAVLTFRLIKGKRKKK